MPIESSVVATFGTTHSAPIEPTDEKTYFAAIFVPHWNTDRSAHKAANITAFQSTVKSANFGTIKSTKRSPDFSTVESAINKANFTAKYLAEQSTKHTADVTPFCTTKHATVEPTEHRAKRCSNSAAKLPTVKPAFRVAQRPALISAFGKTHRPTIVDSVLTAYAKAERATDAYAKRATIHTAYSGPFQSAVRSADGIPFHAAKLQSHQPTIAAAHCAS